mgnify:CR=1 FL=1
MSEATVLKIALETLLEIKDCPLEDKENAYWYTRHKAEDALREIQRVYALGEPSPVVREVLSGVNL